jgi:Cu/Ag efflux protein CusF
MKTRLVWKTAGVMLGMTSLLWAAEVSRTEYTAPQGESPRREVTTQATIQATVEKIDYETRMVTFKDEAGETMEMKAGPEVQRLNDIKKGDVLMVDYLESMALYVHKPAKGEKPSHDTDANAARLAGQKPGIQAGQTERISAEVLKVDVKNRKLKLQGPDGNVITMNVPNEVKRLSEIKKGDHIVAERSVDVIMGFHKP